MTYSCVCFVEMVAADRHCKQEILKLEKELPKWRTALDAGNSPGERLGGV